MAGFLRETDMKQGGCKDLW